MKDHLPEKHLVDKCFPSTRQESLQTDTLRSLESKTWNVSWSKALPTLPRCWHPDCVEVPKCALQSDQRTRLRNKLCTHRMRSVVQQRVLDSGEWFEDLSHQKMVSLVVLHHSWHHRTKVKKTLKLFSSKSKKSSFDNPTGSSARTKTLFKKVIPKAAGRRAQLVISPFSFLQIEVETVSCRMSRFLCHPPLPRKSMRACQDVFWHSCSQNKTKEH